MSQDEVLRMAAEVVDKSTGPLKGIRDTLRGVAREGREHSEALARGMGRVEAGMKGAASAASTVLAPALATVGITGLSLGATLAGIGAAVRNFGSSAKELGQLSRDSGIAASTLRNIQGVLSGVGVDAATSGQALQRFAEDARLAGRGHGEMLKFLRMQGTNEEGRKYFNGLADDIMRSKDAGEMLMKAFKGMERVEGPINKRIYAQNVLKLAEAARVADGRLGSFEDQIKRFQRNNGVISDQDIKDAEDYSRAMDGLKGQMEKLYNAAARELTPTLTEAARAVKAFMDDQRNGVQSEVVKTIRDIKDELAKIDWKTAGKDGLEFLRTTTALAGSLAHSLHTAAQALHALEKGDIAEALRQSTGGAGTVGRLVNKYFPRENKATTTDEALDAQMRGQTMSPEELQGNQNLRRNAGRVAEIEARMGELHTKLDQFGLMEKSGTTSDRSRQQAEDLRREMTRLTDELKRIREGAATVQQQSFDGSGGGMGGLIQKAGYSFPGSILGVGRTMRSYGGGGAYGGGSGPGYSGEQGASPFPRMPNYGPDHPVNRSGRIARGEPEFSAPKGRGAARTADMMRYAMDQLRKEGVPENQLRQAAAHLVGQATMESGLDPNKTHDPDASGRPTGYGIYGARLVRRDRMLRWLKDNGYAPNSPEGQMRYMAREAMNDPAYRATRRILMGGGSGNQERDVNDITKNFEAPKVINRRSGAVRNAFNTGPSAPGGTASSGPDTGLFPDGTPRVLKPDSMPGSPGLTMRQVEELRAGRKAFERHAEVLADPGDERRRPAGAFYTEDEDRRASRDLGIALRFRRQRELADMLRRGEAMKAQSEREKSVTNVNGSVTNIIREPGPKTHIETRVNGNLFQTVKQSDGRQMRRSDD